MNDALSLDIGSHNETVQPRRAMVMLGASNLSRAFPIAVSMSRSVFGSPLWFYVAKGHGRSYGQESSCLGKKNSGIFSSELWSNLTREKGMPISAVITDIGNDLAYEVPVETVLNWVEGCLDRLLALNARVVMTDLPLEALRQVGTLRYRCFRTLLFPGCQLDWNEMLRRAESLSESINQLASKHEIPVFTVPNQWYGLDPIHPRRKFLPSLWASLLERLSNQKLEDGSISFSWRESWYLRRLQPARWSFFSIPRSHEQPVGQLDDGSTISLF